MTTGDPASFGAWLKQRREAMDLTRKEVAWATGCSVSTIRKLESGERKPSKQVIDQLANCLEITAAERPAFLQLARENSKRALPEQLPAVPLTTLAPAQLLSPPLSPQPEADPGLPRQAVARVERVDPEALGQGATNLPAALTSFVGRGEIVDQLRSLLWRVDVRLITLTGPGGVGKTRLAVEAAAGLLGDFADGIFFVSLAPVRDPELVISAIAHILGVRESQGRTLADNLSQYLASKNMLLVLDNFEQVLNASQQVSSLLQVARRLKVLVTSRVPLHLYGEHELAVPPLEVPSPGVHETQHPAPANLEGYEAVQLFVKRSQAVRPSFALTQENAVAVAEICRKLDGLPLALELAAARTKYYSPQAIVTRLGNPLDLLTGGAQDLPARHQTLRAALAWSYGLLHANEQALFRRLGVFVGSFSLEAAEAIAHADCWVESSENGSIANSLPDMLMLLADNSLLLQEESLGEPRFRMLETIREFAIEETKAHSEEFEARQQHALYYLAFAETAGEKTNGSSQLPWLDQVETEHGNLRAALRWLIEQGQDNAEWRDMALRLGVALSAFWDSRGYITEGRTWLAEVLHDGESPLRDANGEYNRALRASALDAAGKLAWNQGDTPAARAFYESSLALCQELGDMQGLAKSLNGLGNIEMYAANNEAARERYEASLVLAREVGDERLQARILNNLGGLLRNMQDFATARHYLKQSVELYRNLEDRAGMVVPLGNLGLLAIDQGEYAEARGYQEEALPICRELGHKNNLAFALTFMGLRAVEERDYGAARDFYLEGLPLAYQLGYKSVLAGCFESIGGMCEALGRPLEAARLWGSATVTRTAISVPMPLPARGRYERHLVSARSLVDALEFDAAWAEGEGMAIEQTITAALALLSEQSVFHNSPVPG